MAERVLRALVTRPREDSEALASALSMRGIEPVIEPLMQVRYVASTALNLNGVQAVLCTSANGVRALAQASRQRRVLLMAVGDATATRARFEGFTTVESAGGDVGDLARVVAARLRPQDGKLLHVTGSVVAGDLAAALRGQGFAVERRVLYEAQPAAMLSSTTTEALRAGLIEFALFYSPRTASIFIKLAAAAEVMNCCATITAVSISAAADAAIGDVPWLDRRVAERPNQSSLLEALDRVLSKRARA